MNFGIGPLRTDNSQAISNPDRLAILSQQINDAHVGFPGINYGNTASPSPEDGRIGFGVSENGENAWERDESCGYNGGGDVTNLVTFRPSMSTERVQFFDMPVYYQNLAFMPEFNGKSQEEVRLEHYQLQNKPLSEKRRPATSPSTKAPSVFGSTTIVPSGSLSNSSSVPVHQTTPFGYSAPAFNSRVAFAGPDSTPSLISPASAPSCTCTRKELFSRGTTTDPPTFSSSSLSTKTPTKRTFTLPISTSISPVGFTPTCNSAPESFSFGGTQRGSIFGGSNNTQSPGFIFGSESPNTPTQQFVNNKSTRPFAQTSSDGFVFGSPSPSAKTNSFSGFGFGSASPSTQTSSSGLFSFGQPSPSSQTSSSGLFSFGQPSPSTQTSFPSFTPAGFQSDQSSTQTSTTPNTTTTDQGRVSQQNDNQEEAAVDTELMKIRREMEQLHNRLSTLEAARQAVKK